MKSPWPRSSTKTARGQKIKDTIVIVALLHTIAILLKYTYRQNPLFHQLQIIFLSHISIIWNDFLLLLTENSKCLKNSRSKIHGWWTLFKIFGFWNVQNVNSRQDFVETAPAFLKNSSWQKFVDILGMFLSSFSGFRYFPLIQNW